MEFFKHLLLTASRLPPHKSRSIYGRPASRSVPGLKMGIFSATFHSVVRGAADSFHSIIHISITYPVSKYRTNHVNFHITGYWTIHFSVPFESLGRFRGPPFFIRSSNWSSFFDRTEASQPLHVQTMATILNFGFRIFPRRKVKNKVCFHRNNPYGRGFSLIIIVEI